MVFILSVLVLVAVFQLAVRARDREDLDQLRRRVDGLEHEQRIQSIRDTRAAETTSAPSHAPASAPAPPAPARVFDAEHEHEHVHEAEDDLEIAFGADDVPVPAAPAPPARAPGTRMFDPVQPSPAPRAAPGPRERSLVERIIAEHALALVGGLFVLVAAIFFVTYAIDQGWIGPRLRIAIALAFGAALVAAGVRVASRLTPQERTGRAIGSLHGVLAGTGAAVAFLAVVAAVRLEEVMSPLVGVAAQVLIAAIVVLLARRWRSQDLAAFGMGVGLAAPMLVGATATTGTVALLSVALLASVALGIVERWPRLLLAAMLITAPQLADAGATGQPDLAGVVGMLLAWWAVLVAGAIACGLRSETSTARSVVGVILATPLAAAGAFEVALSNQFDPVDNARAVFLLLFAVANVLAAAVVHSRWRGRSEVVVIALLGAGMSLLAAMVGEVGDGAAVAAAWLAESVALAAVWWHSRSRTAGAFAAALGAAALLHIAVLDAPPALLTDRGVSLREPLLALAALLVASLAARALLTRVAGWTSPVLTSIARSLEVLAPFAAWYAVAIVLAHTAAPAIVSLQLGAWSAFGGIFAVAAHCKVQRDELLAIAGIALVFEIAWLADGHHGNGSALWVYVPAALVLAAIASHPRGEGIVSIVATATQTLLAVLVVGWAVPPSNLRVYDEPDLLLVMLQLLAGFIAVAALLGAVERWKQAPPEWRRALHATAALGALYALSIVVVAVLTPQPGTFEQGAQVTLTLTWVALGVAALFAGTSERLRQHVELRVGAYALLGLAAAKLVLVDTADLGTPQRMLAFLVTGLGLLGSAALEQRMRGGDLRR